MNMMKFLKLRRKTILALKRIFERKQRQRLEQISLNVSLNKECKVESNLYISLEELEKPLFEEIKFKRDISECASCIFGDPGLSCTCSFKRSVPDFKLYEDVEAYLF